MANLYSTRSFSMRRCSESLLSTTRRIHIAISTMKRSATLCSRINQNKNKPFKLEIFLGSLQFSYHPFFSREDTLIQEMRYLMKKYRTRADLALLPHYKKTKDILQKELSDLQNRADYPKKEMQIIKQELDKTEKLFAEEKTLLQNIMNQIYNKWEAIKLERKTHDYIGSPFKLVVRQYLSNELTNEIEFVLQEQDVNRDATGRGQPIPRQELSRRAQINAFPVQLLFLVNNRLVAKSKKQNLTWPKFQCDFKEKLQVYVFTKPSTIKLVIMQATLVPRIIDTIEIEIPGEKSNTITSAGFVLKEAYFSQGREDVRKQRYQTLVMQTAQNKQILDEEELEKAKANAFEGFISYRTEWAGYGSNMPPDSMDMQYAETYQKFEDEEEEVIFNNSGPDKRDPTYFDVNDPRNEDIMLKLQQQRKASTENNSECQVPLSKVRSLRQQLLKLRFIQPDLQDFTIPMLQDLIRFNPKLVEFIEQEDEQRNYELELNRQQKADGPQILEDFIREPQTRKRLLIIQSILHQRKIEARLKKSTQSGGLMNLENVVNEFHFAAAASLLAECCRQIFTKRRKLGPQRRSQLEKKNVLQIPEVQLSILVVQANNVPIRSESLKDLKHVQNKLSNFSEIKEVVDQLFKMKKVTPAISLELDIDSKNVYIIKSGQHEEKVKKDASKGTAINRQEPNLQAFMDANQEEGKEIDQEEYIVVPDRILAGHRAVEMTSEVEGINPEWNELIDFRIGRERTNMSFDPQDIINSRNKLVLTLYDQMGSFRQEPGNVDRYRLAVKRHYLGQVTIPLLTVFQQEKISGTFRIQRPLMMINYQTLKVDQFLSQAQDNDENGKENITALHSRYNIIDPHIPTTLELTMTLDPAIKVNEQFASTDYFPGAELTNFFLYGVRHLEMLQRHSTLKNRNIKFWAENIRGESVFLPRYLTPLQPPQMDQGNLIEKAARFVSLIPFKNDTEHFQDLPDIYCDAQEFIDLRAGDFEEHAILLCCYFMYIDQKINKRDDIKSYVVMGKGLPEGNTQYVMRRLLGSSYVEIWNPQTGEPFVFQNEEYTTKLMGIFSVSKGFKNMNDIEDQACPLNSIGCIFDDQNVYVNIQPSDSPAEISYNIENPILWEPFLHKEQYKAFFPKGIESVQKELAYDPADVDRAREVQAKLQQFIQQKIEEHRKNSFAQHKNFFTTTFATQKYAEFSTYVGDQLLIKLESFKFRIRTTGLAKEANARNLDKKEERQEQPSMLQSQEGNMKQWDYEKSLQFLSKEQFELQRKKDHYIPDGRQMYGFPLNFSYIDDEKAWDEVKATGIQDILSDDLEYICTVRCFAYPHYLISCWVFIAVLHDANSLQ